MPLDEGKELVQPAVSIKVSETITSRCPFVQPFPPNEVGYANNPPSAWATRTEPLCAWTIVLHTCLVGEAVTRRTSQATALDDGRSNGQGPT